ncbi:glycoside hydrolase family 76 protein [Edaphobacter sp. 12200R-103]|jgi:predicted alpha-1,6-mannanase (GH76 family)|uniref:glycoside hydrolase family 76 protein n=1 Tax=Edaphobacter sp. 12200R-103 TaxID=2703788 RepID=UPI00138DABCE|nr:glycoside hydrolase family 76 protein [Edaphobacter sp. 12200R-103]QHS52461.1 glycoside hydrolase family 76 protein [Edaphobacter sp. 12200R-103]
MIFRRAVALALSLFASATLCPAQAPSKEASQRAQLGVEALQQWYVPKMGLYRTTGWWNSANAITAITDYMRLTGSKKYTGVLANTYKQAQITIPKEQRTDAKKELTGFPGFLNNYYDDEGWWALAWIDAYDLTHDARYLTMARSIFDDMAASWDDTCSGGIWWSKDKKYKNAIANELFFSVAAHLASRVYSADGQKYADWAAKEWKWFYMSGMINGDHLVNDGLTIDAGTGKCSNNKKTIWTYNQGVLIGALAEWSRTGGGADILTHARQIADAAVAHFSDKAGVIHEPCEPNCGADGIQFKGIFVRNLRDLNNIAAEPVTGKAIAANAEAIWTKNRTSQNTFGTVWSGPITTPDAGTQSSALDALNAAITLEK